MAQVNKRILLLVCTICTFSFLVWLALVPRKSEWDLKASQLIRAYDAMGTPTATQLYSRQGGSVVMKMQQRGRDALSKRCKGVAASSELFWLVAIHPDPATVGCRQLPLIASIPHRDTARPIYLQWREGSSRLMGERKNQSWSEGSRFHIVVEVNATQLGLVAQPDARITLEFEAFF